MPFAYSPSVTPELRQGEILSPVVELRVRYPATLVPEGTNPLIDPYTHPRMVVVTADCDLLKDHIERQKEAPRPPNLLSHVLLCDVYSEEELADGWPEGFASKERRAAKQNQNERFHTFPSATVDTTNHELPLFIIDFKNTIGIPPAALYDGISNGSIARLGCVPPVFLQDLCHRLYGFLSRVGPDF